MAASPYRPAGTDNAHPVAGAAGLTVTEAWSRQISLVLQQLINHPSVMRYTLANEFYLNRTANPIEKLFEDTVRALDPTRMARQADPTTVGQRHGPYHFDVGSGAGYDCWGGRWSLPSSCSAVNFASAGCCNGSLSTVPLGGSSMVGRPGCRYSTHDGGPGDPFEWSEFGANAISDIQTLSYVLPAPSLAVSNVGDSMWGVHKAGMWLDKALWTAVFKNGTGAPFRSLEEIVQVSQWLQAEGYRFAYQAGRRRKWHHARSHRCGRCALLDPRTRRV